MSSTEQLRMHAFDKDVKRREKFVCSRKAVEDKGYTPYLVNSVSHATFRPNNTQEFEESVRGKWTEYIDYHTTPGWIITVPEKEIKKATEFDRIHDGNDLSFYFSQTVSTMTNISPMKEDNIGLGLSVEYLQS